MTDFEKVQYVRQCCFSILPQLYCDRFSITEQIGKIVNALNKLIENNNKLEDYVEEIIREVIESGEIETIIKDMLANYILNVKFPPEGITPAIGDGTADDTEAIQGCIDYANLNGGKAVYFPSGKYLTKSLILKDNVSLIGFDRSTTHLVHRGGAITPLLSGDTNNNSILNLTFDGNMDIQVNNINTVVLHGKDYIFNNITFTDGYTLLTLNLTGNAQINCCEFGLAVKNSSFFAGTGLINASNLTFVALSELNGKYIIENKINNSMFNDIISTCNVVTAIKNDANNCVFTGNIINALNTYVETGTNNYYNFYNRGGTNTDKLEEEKNARISADNVLRNDIILEVNNRKNEDVLIREEIHDESIKTETAINLLNTDLNAEREARIYADNLLDEKINNLKPLYVNVKDFGAKGDGITDDTQAFKNAVGTGITVFIPFTETGYNLNTGGIVLPESCFILGENKVVLKSNATNLFIIQNWRSGISKVSIDMSFAGVGSTAILFKTSARVINRTRISEIDFIHCYSCIQDEITPTNYVVDLVVHDIYIYYTRGTSINFRRTRGFITFRETKIDHTYNTYPVTWNSAMFTDLIGLELEKFDVVGPTIEGTPPLYQNVFGVYIEGTGQGQASVWLTRLLIDNTMCNGLSIKNVNYLVCNNIECFQNLGINFYFFNVKNSQLNNVFSFGGIDMEGFVESANGITFENCQNIELTNVKTMRNSGTGLLLNNCQNLLITNLTSIQNNAFGVYEITTDKTIKNNVIINSNIAGALLQTGDNSRYCNAIINNVLNPLNIDGPTSR